jgi:hypothetical protein
MTRKDYDRLAGGFLSVVMNGEKHSPDALSMYRALAESIADELAKDNPRFVREKFLNSAGFPVAFGKKVVV